MSLIKIINSVLTLTFLFCQSILATNPDQFPNCYQSEHFRVFLENEDINTANELISVLELNYRKLSADFEHQLSEKIMISVFSDIESFHKRIGNPNAPAWAVAWEGAEFPSILIVSPANPGNFHTADTLYKIAIVRLNNLFVSDKFGSDVPYWLNIGTSYFEAEMPLDPIKDRIRTLMDNGEPVPQLSQLEVFDKNFYANFGGYSYAYTLVAFINSKWGWNAILALMEDSNSFNIVLGMSHSEFREQWIEFLKEFACS